MNRYALVCGPSKTVARYLPDNYSVLGPAGEIGDDSDLDYLIRVAKNGCVVVGGSDDHGWTMDGYVIPRLHSGLYGAREISEQTA